MEEWPKINNAMESWHKRFNIRFPKAKINLLAFIMRLKNEYKYIIVKLLNYELNPASPVSGRGRRKVVFCCIKIKLYLKSCVKSKYKNLFKMTI